MTLPLRSQLDFRANHPSTPLYLSPKDTDSERMSELTNGNLSNLSSSTMNSTPITDNYDIYPDSPSMQTEVNINVDPYQIVQFSASIITVTVLVTVLTFFEGTLFGGARVAATLSEKGSLESLVNGILRQVLEMPDPSLLGDAQIHIKIIRRLLLTFQRQPTEVKVAIVQEIGRTTTNVAGTAVVGGIAYLNCRASEAHESKMRSVDHHERQKAREYQDQQRQQASTKPAQSWFRF